MGGKLGADSVKSPGEAFGNVKKGKATVTIPWFYKSTLKMGAGEHKFADVDSKLETDASGKTTITKGGHSVTKVLDAVTEGDPWKCP